MQRTPAQLYALRIGAVLVGAGSLAFLRREQGAERT
jgi:hypothetical protein